MKAPGIMMLKALFLPGSGRAQSVFSWFLNSSIQWVGHRAEVVSCLQGGRCVAMSLLAGQICRLDTRSSTSAGDARLTLFDSSDIDSPLQYNDDD
jgi:hypothetical protein